MSAAPVVRRLPEAGRSGIGGRRGFPDRRFTMSEVSLQELRQVHGGCPYNIVRDIFDQLFCAFFGC
jgi:hypothetical protein